MAREGNDCAIFYPIFVGYHRTKCAGALWNESVSVDENIHSWSINPGEMKLYDYIEARKNIYFPLYTEAVKKEKLLTTLYTHLVIDMLLQLLY